MYRAVAICLALLLPLPGLTIPLQENSVVATEFDFIRAKDPDAFHCLGYTGTERREMPDRRRETVFAARFLDGTEVGSWVHPEIGDQSAAEEHARRLTGPLCKLPTFMRRSLNHIVVYEGDLPAFAEDRGRFFIAYSDNMTTRLSDNDPAEMVFVHSTLDIPLAESREWRAAQQADNAFVTVYAAEHRDQEDMAESALFAWAVLRHPRSLPG